MLQLTKIHAQIHAPSMHHFGLFTHHSWQILHHSEFLVHYEPRSSLVQKIQFPFFLMKCVLSDLVRQHLQLNPYFSFPQLRLIKLHLPWVQQHLFGWNFSFFMWYNVIHLLLFSYDCNQNWKSSQREECQTRRRGIKYVHHDGVRDWLYLEVLSIRFKSQLRHTKWQLQKQAR